MQQLDVIDFALQQQDIRFRIANEIKGRREGLGHSAEVFSKMLGCSKMDLNRLEQGLLFFQMPAIRLQALILLDRLEMREVGKRNSDAKQPTLRCVK